MNYSGGFVAQCKENDVESGTESDSDDDNNDVKIVSVDKPEIGSTVKINGIICVILNIVGIIFLV